MSVAAMTMDDQRPLMNTYDKMSKQCEQNNLHVAGGGGGGGSVAMGMGMGVGGAPPSGPASPTPSGGDDMPPNVHQFHHSASSHHHHAHHHHQHHHSRHHQHAVDMPPQQAPPSPTTPASHHHNQQHHHHQQQSSSTATSTTVAEAVAAVEHRQRLLEEEIDSLKQEQTRLSQQCADAQRREKILMRRLANKEQEFQDYVSQIAEYKAAQAPTALALRSALLDPAVNLLFEKLKKELKATKAKLEETQNELSAWKFTPDSNTGKRLMAKCRLLYQENEELGKMTSSGRLAKLETELAMQKSFCEEIKKTQSELDDFFPELDEDVEGMQSTILFLQQELKTTRDRIQALEVENAQLKNGQIGDVAKEAESSHLCLNGVSNAPLSSLPDHNAITLKNASSLPLIHPSQSVHNNKETKFQITPLATIDENECGVVRPFASSNTNEFYNGNEEQLTALSNTTGVIAAVEEPTNMIRTAAARKRNHDEVHENLLTSSPSVVAPPLIHVAVPRTLPPKKSKLRRASVQSAEMNEYDNCQAQAMPNVGVISSAAEGLNIVDNAVAGMANEENPAGMLPLDDAMESGGVAQRIMTRRRSVRTQQNGGNGEGSH